MKTVVYYYSLTGNCEKISLKIAARLGCGSERIVEKKKRPSKGFLKFINGGAAMQNKISEIKPLENDPENFEQIIIVTPFWAARPTPAIRGFIDRYGYKLKDKTIGLALSNLGSDPEDAFKKYRELFPAGIKTISFTKAKNEWTEPVQDELIEKFVKELQSDQ